MKLLFCKDCIQMTNHNVFNAEQVQCLKCGKGNKKHSPKTSKEKNGK